MAINVDGIKNHFHVGYQFAVEQGSKLAGHAVTYFKQGLELVRQDVRVAGLAVAVTNVMILHFALLTTTVADKIFVRLCGPEEEWSERAILTRNTVTVIYVVSIIAGLNIALYQRLKSPLSPLVTGVISIAAIASYGLLSAWRAGSSGSE